MRARAWPLRQLDCLFEECPARPGAGIEVVFGRLNLSPDDSVAVGREGQLRSQLGELGGRLRRSPGAGEPGSLVELGRDRGIGGGCSKREVPGALLTVIHVLGQATVNGAALGPTRHPVDG